MSAKRKKKAPETEETPMMEAGPIRFAEVILGGKLYPWQDQVLRWFEDPTKRMLGALVTPNGAGKSSGVVAALALWWASVHRRGKVVITTKDSKQLDQQIYPAMERHRPTLKGWTWTTSPYIEIRAASDHRKRRGKIVAFTTNDAGRAEGWHKDDDYDGPLLIIVDEAKSVEEEIFRAIDRCTYNALLYVSSPGLALGSFYDAFTRNRPLFACRTVSLEDCPHIPKERIKGIIDKYGEKHPFTRSTVFGEFMDQDEGMAVVFPLRIVEKSLATAGSRLGPQASRHTDQSAFCDFAAGGDENVLAIRSGNRLEIAAAWRDRDTMAAVGRFIIEFTKAGLQSHEIFADEGGLGKPMIDALWRSGWEVNRVNNGQKAYDPAYEARGAEMWHETAAAATRGEVILPADDDLISQLTTRRASITSDGRLGIEPKRELAKRNLPSPDRADAICGAWTCRGKIVLRGFSGVDPEQEFDETPDAEELAGMDAG
jgi:hypothetical protein